MTWHRYISVPANTLVKMVHFIEISWLQYFHHMYHVGGCRYMIYWWNYRYISTFKSMILYEVKSDDLVSYFQYATQLMEKFERISLVHIPWKESQMVDALANLATSLTLIKMRLYMSLFTISGYCHNC